MVPRRRTLRAAGLLLALPLAAPAAGQYEGAAPTRRQQQHLEPLVKSVALRLELYVPSITASDVERRVRKALFNQNSDVARRRYEDLVVELLADDLDLEGDDRERVRYELLEGFGKGFAPLDLTLAGVEREDGKGLDKEPYRLDGIKEHKGCVTHDQSTIDKVTAWVGPELDAEQKRGTKELAEHWEPILCDAFGVERDRRFRELLESALATPDTDRALLATLCKLRCLVRSSLREVLQIEDYAHEIAAREQIDQRLERVLSDAEWWPELRADHVAMISDPKAQRKVVAARERR